MEVQSEHHIGVTKSIEGVLVNCFPVGSNTLLMDFHSSFLSNEKTQMASTLTCHARMMFGKLQEEGILEAGGRVLGMCNCLVLPLQCRN